MTMKDALLQLGVLLFLYQTAQCLIIPEELPTVLSLIYSNIPPVKKGTDSRLGVGFRLGEHADFQILVELGPQTETDPISSTDSKRRRDAMLTAAMRGELGPFAQAVARYQLERALQKELERLNRTAAELEKKKPAQEQSQAQKTAASEWLSNFAKGPSPVEEVPPTKTINSNNIERRLARPGKLQTQEEKVLELAKLYELQAKKSSETRKE